MEIKITPKKIIKIGSSCGVLISKQERKILNIKEGDYLDISDVVPIAREDVEGGKE